LALAGCSSPPPSLAVASAPIPQPIAWKAVLIAGDDREPAFDNAVDAMARKLRSFGVSPSNIAVLKADGRGPQAATGQNVLDAFDRLDPGPGEGCFVFVTSHGGENAGLVIRSANAFLEPRDMGGLLDRSCGERPTVVIASGCYSGIFAEGGSVPAPNRMILTAARDDRRSFGCSADRQFTVFDQCVLGHLKRGRRWTAAMQEIRDCVAANEQSLGVDTPSSPQISAGADVVDLEIF